MSNCPSNSGGATTIHSHPTACFVIFIEKVGTFCKVITEITGAMSLKPGIEPVRCKVWKGMMPALSPVFLV